MFSKIKALLVCITIFLFGASTLAFSGSDWANYEGRGDTMTVTKSPTGVTVSHTVDGTNYSATTTYTTKQTTVTVTNPNGQSVTSPASYYSYSSDNSSDDGDSSTTYTGPAGMPLPACSNCTNESQEKNNSINSTISNSAKLTGIVRNAYENTMTMIYGSANRELDRDRQASPTERAEINKTIALNSQVAYEAAMAVQNLPAKAKFIEYRDQDGNLKHVIANKYVQAAFYGTLQSILDKGNIPENKRLTPKGPMDYIANYANLELSQPEKDAGEFVDRKVASGDMYIRPPIRSGGNAISVFGESATDTYLWKDLSATEKIGRATAFTVIGSKEDLVRYRQLAGGFGDDIKAYKEYVLETSGCGTYCKSDPDAFWGGLSTGYGNELPGTQGGTVLVLDGQPFSTSKHEYDHAGLDSVKQHLDNKGWNWDPVAKNWIEKETLDDNLREISYAVDSLYGKIFRTFGIS